MEETPILDRRKDARMASKVQCGVSLQFIAGLEESRRYLLNCGVPPDVVDRVLSYPSTRRPSEAVEPADRRHEAAR